MNPEATSYAEHRFGGLRYSEAGKCLVRDDGTEISLRPKSLAVFAHLAGRANTVVSKDELFSAVWGNLQVTDDSLVQCIADIRRALGDNAHEILKTAPRQGYQLVADAVAPVAIEAADDASQTEPVYRKKSAHRMRWRMASIAALVALAAFVTLLANRGPTAPATQANSSRAALEHADEKPNASAIEQGTPAGEIVPTSQVAPPANAAASGTPAVRIRLAAGSRPGDSDLLNTIKAELRVALSRYKTVRLTDANETDYQLTLAINGQAATGQRLFVEALETSSGTIFMADSIDVPAGEKPAQSLAVRVAAFASPGGGALARHLMSTAQYKPVDQLTRAQCYAHGYDCTNCSGELETITERAEICLDKLLKENPNDATAWALKSTIHTNQYRFGYTVREPERSNLQARAHRADMAVDAAYKAEQLSDGTDTAIYWGMAQAYSAKCNVDKMRAAIDRGLAINPTDPSLMAAFGNWLAYTGQWDEGAALVERAFAIEPRLTRRWWIYGPAKRHFARGEYAQAHTLMRRAYTEKDWVSHMILAYTLPYLGRLDEARQMGKRTQELNPGFTIEKALQFYKVFCFPNDFIAKIKWGLAQAGLPSRGSSTNLDRIELPPIKVIPINGAPIEYLDMGKGEPVVFVHGAVGDYRGWGYYEVPISAQHRFISLSQRYHGSQPWVDDKIGKASLQDYAADLGAFIDALNLGPVHLVTWSFGGTVGSLLAASRPDLLKSALHFEPTSLTVAKDHPQFGPAMGAFRPHLGPALESAGAGKPENAARRMIEGVFGKSVGTITDESVGFERVITQNGKSLAPLFFRQPNVLMSPVLTCDYLSATTAPTLVVSGTKTHKFFTLNAEQFTRCIPGAKHVTVPGVGHDGPLRKVDTITALILKHVADNTAR